MSDGIATVDAGLRIAAYDGAKVTILTEGNNSKHLKRWIELNFPTDVHVFEGLEEHTSAGQLLEYGRLLGSVQTNTHFVVVWDCDAARNVKALREDLSGSAKVTPYAFPRRQENTIAPRGIENNYDDEILEHYATTTTASDGTVLGRGFRGDLKTEFANHVLEHGTKEYFANYRDLQKLVSRLLKA